METIRKKIAMIDDDSFVLNMGKNILNDIYEVIPALSAAKFFEITMSVIPDLILLDIEMPEMDGYEAMKKIKADERIADMPVIFLTAKTDESNEIKGFELGASDYISKPFSTPILLKRIANQLLISKQKKDLKDYADNLEQKVHYKTREVVNLQNAVLNTVADLIEYRDKLTGGHINRTRFYLKALVEEIIREGIYMEEISKWNIDFFLQSAQLHDVGKIAISDLILNKPGKLDYDEYEIMKTHVDVGVEAIEGIMRSTEDHNFLDYALLITKTHHEKWDGSGYPNKLRGEEIPLEGRIMAIVDVYDALISARPYKKPFSHREACEIIEGSSGTHFDPVLVEVFKKVEDEFARIVESTKV
jgi:putative two-component system response regulator